MDATQKNKRKRKKNDRDENQLVKIGLKSIKPGIRPGDKLKLVYTVEGGEEAGKIKRKVKGKVLSTHKHYVRLDLGAYTESFTWWDVWKYGRR